MSSVRIAAGTLPQALERYASLSTAERQSTLAGLAPRRVFLDLETTGFDADADRVIEIGAVVVDSGAEVDSYQAFVLPAAPIPGAVTDFTGITESMVSEDGVQPVVAADRLRDLIEGAEVVAFNAGFEERFLAALARRTGVPLPTTGFLDALELARIVLPRLTKHRQEDLCAFFGIHEGKAHRALGDARALSRLFDVLLGGVEALDPRVSSAVAALSPDTEWPLRRLFVEGSRRAGGRGNARRRAGMPNAQRPDLVEWRRAAPTSKTPRT